jgi:exopolyphosphatase/guanosine-5'-triphosphate,3'-diphosphate pyrophosphatase
LATQKGAKSLYVFATEAMRIAENHEQVKDRIWDSTKVEIDIIPPEREAELSLIGTGLDTYLRDVNLLFEVGGGSAQIAQIEGGKIAREVSLPLGTGKLIVKAALRNPCPTSSMLAAEDYIEETLEKGDLQIEGKVAVASGGVVRGLWRALHPDGERTLALEELEYMAWASSHLPIDAIMRRFSVKQKRGSTLLPGALVYRALVKRHKVRELRISEYGIREGAVLQMAKGATVGSAL